MDFPKGFHQEVIESRESTSDIDFSVDSVKNRVDVSPLISGGSNFKTHTLVVKSSSKIIYRPSLGGALFVLLFVVIGIGIVTYQMINDSGLMSDPTISNFMLLSIGLIFTILGGVFCYFIFKPRVFDKQTGYYYKNYTFKLHEKDLKHQFRLRSIIAVQIIGETIKSDDGSYGSFELNLVLEDHSRRNVVDHGNLRSIIDDAHILSDFLNVPIWHAESN